MSAIGILIMVFAGHAGAMSVLTKRRDDDTRGALGWAALCLVALIAARWML